MAVDKAGKAYWDKAWEKTVAPGAVNPRLRGLNNYVNRRFHDYFSKAFAGVETRDKNLVELGCAKSSWLPYFAQEFGFNVTGIDYSEIGCQQAKEALNIAGVSGEIVCGDFFSLPPQVEQFDAAVSFGVVEHYENTAECIGAFSRLLKPGGMILTIIPNMVGLMGSMQKFLDQDVYEVHVPLDRCALAEAHSAVGLEDIQCEYFMFVNFNILNPRYKPRGLWYRSFVRARSWTSKAVWLTESALLSLPPNRFTSPYVVCRAKRPAGS